MVEELVLSLDIGTGSSRAAIYSLAEDRQLTLQAAPAKIYHPQPDRAEFSPEQWWQVIRTLMRQAVEKIQRPAGDYAGITVTSLRQGFLLLDQQGAPLTRGVLNYDRRGAECIALIEGQIPIEQLYNLTGHWHAPELTLPKILWFQKHEPQIWAHTNRIAFIHDWLLLLLTGEIASHSSFACAGQMADISNQTWARSLLAQLDIPEEILPPLLNAGAIIGGLRPEVAEEVGLSPETPVMVGAGDAQFGCLGAGGLQTDTVVIVGGSTTPILLTSNQPLFDSKRYPWVSTHLLPDTYAIEMNAGHTGMLYTWFRDEFAEAEKMEAERLGENLYHVLNQKAASAPLGAQGLRVLASSPRWAQDTWERKAPYTIYNFQVGLTKADFARAIMESVCFAVRGNLEQLERIQGKPIGELIFTGGSARVPFWSQMMVDVLGRAMSVPQRADSLGRAGALVVSSGRDDLTYPIKALDFVQYDPDKTATSQYQEHYEEYVALFESLQQRYAR